MRLVRWMCNVKLKEFQVELRDSLGIGDNLGTTARGWDRMGLCCENNTLIG